MRELVIRRVALVFATLLVAAIGFGGFGQTFTTDASWSDANTATGSFRSAPLPELGPVTNPVCTDTQGAPPKPITLTWDKPTDAADYDVVYDVSWRHIGTSDYEHHETSATEFGPFLPDAESSEHVAEIELIVQARIAGTTQQGKPVKFYAKGPVGNGILTCMNPQAFS